MTAAHTSDTSHDSRLSQSFYAIALDEADRAGLDEARQLEGLAEEIALLRLRVRDALIAHRDDTRLIETGVRLLIQSLLAQHRISAGQAEQTLDTATEWMREITATMERAPRE